MNENDNSQENQEPQQITFTAVTVQQKIAEKIKSSGENVANMVIDSLVEKELKTRQELIIKGISEVDKATKNLNKINRPDMKSFDGDRKEVPGYSEQRMKDIKKGEEDLARVTKLVNDALSKNDAESYSKLAGAKTSPDAAE